MNNDKLKTANHLKDEIKLLDDFIWHSRKSQTKIIKKETKISLKNIAMVLGTKEIEISNQLNEKILKILETHKEDLEKEFESL